MTCNTRIIPMIIIVFFSVMIISSCGSHRQKADEAFDLVKKEKMLSDDSNLIREALIQEPVNAGLAKKKEPQDKWIIYKIETEKKIQTNENSIREIKANTKANSNLLKKVLALEKENNDLRILMDKYNEEMTLKWENFKTMMNHDVNDIGIRLKALKINQK